MKFGPVPLAQAEGAILAHSIGLPSGRLRKGVILGAAELARLREAGLEDVTVARLEPDDVAEDEAAARIARALVPDAAAAGLRIGAATTGRVNLHATGPGVLALDEGRIRALNQIDPMITLATLAPFTRLEDRTLVATIKIISYGLDGAKLAAAEAAGLGAIRRAAPVARTARLIETTIAGQEMSAKGRAATKTRLDRMGVALAPREMVAHETAALADVLRARPADLHLILTGSATSDPMDVGPEALRRAGGTVTRFGMPADPGNLLFVGELNGTPVIGLPGCARSLALNGADWVMERVICGIDVSDDDIAGMGIGGLLKEPPSRPKARE